MKKLVFMLCTLLCGTAYADGTKTCIVKETDGSVEVSVMVTDEQNGKCIVSFSNDTDKNVNVRYTLSDGEAPAKEISGSALVYANSESTRQLSFNKKVAANRVKISSLSGEKCQ